MAVKEKMCKEISHREGSPGLEGGITPCVRATEDSRLAVVLSSCRWGVEDNKTECLNLARIQYHYHLSSTLWLKLPREPPLQKSHKPFHLVLLFLEELALRLMYTQNKQAKYRKIPSRWYVGKFVGEVKYS